MQTALAKIDQISNNYKQKRKMSILVRKTSLTEKYKLKQPTFTAIKAIFFAKSE